MLKFLKSYKVIRIIDVCIYSLPFFIIVNLVRHGFVWTQDRYDILFLLAIILLGVKALLNVQHRSKTNDEFKRQISLEIFVKTYSLVLPILFLVGTGVLRVLGYNHEARVVIVIIGIIFYTEKLVRDYVYTKYDYHDFEKEND